MNAKNVKFVTEPSRKIKVLAETEVLVLGSGPAGVGAAIAAAREDADTLLIDRLSYLGGTLTAVQPGLILQKAEFIGGIFEEVVRRMESENSMRNLPDDDLWTNPPNLPMPPDSMYSYDPENLKIVLLSMCEDAGVRLLFHTWFSAPLMKNGSPVGVFVESKSGRNAIFANIIIDCTGDADFVFRAGGKCVKQDLPMRVTKTMRVGGVTSNKWFGMKQFSGRVRTIFGHSTGPVDGTNVLDITRAEIECSKGIRNFCNELRNQKGFEDSYLIATGNAGIRETRQIVGIKTLKDTDVIEGKRFPDGIVRSNYPTDLHSSDGSEQPPKFLRPKSGWYEIPYGVMVPKTLDNTLTAGRCISAERLAMSSMRVTPVCLGLGQAAGTAAAECVRENKQPREIDGKRLRQTLKKQGMALPED